ncbi:hypothetical protein IEU95_08650 [Hoyosella rhizosphaerae]|uniref:Integral membrane protein n=1 Tax=Hoyosella rhizosphaerae TaxID=1755582 RepID=A0A916U0I1_9ACTN|nr:hypothetical protein [Hoyosella rhizosphaerae]MBN4926898.1 hypothetical protein [Hoyosella rhizosphaerae]GGC55647.1 hypothetical protein GCM10011410_05060 [Hoyosella rhizosphaerae]
MNYSQYGVADNIERPQGPVVSFASVYSPALSTYGRNALPLIAGTAIYMVAGIAIGLVPLIGWVIASLIMVVLTCQLVACASTALQGNRLTIVSMFDFSYLPRILAAQFVYTATVVVGIILLIIPGIIAFVLGAFSAQAAAHGANPVRAVTTSWRLVVANPVHALLAVFTAMALAIAGSLFLGFGYAVTGPLACLILTAFYRSATGVSESPTP